MPANHEAAILTRVLRAQRNDLSPEAAKALLKLSFTEHDRERKHELAVKNQDGALTRAERVELDGYRRVGRLLDLLAAFARRSLARHDRGA